MILCIPFLASDPAQFDPSWPDLGFGVEAALFDRRDIVDPDRWDTVRRVVRGIARGRRPPAFVFHFPVNDCDYVDDAVVRDRLYEAIELAGDHGLDGVVLHSNRIRHVDEWRVLDVARERETFARFVDDLRVRSAGAGFWIGLENMPITGNDANELDPLLVFPDDYAGLIGGNIGVTWDFCHFSYSVYVAGRLAAGLQPDPEDYPNTRSAEYLDFERLGDAIVHHHFSAFSGLAVKGGAVCVEGSVPWAGTLPEQVYRDALLAMSRSPRAATVTLEISEADYRARSVVFDVARWCREVLAATP